ncbi:hypothetical protein GCM10010278_86320 [Streptomyces melanogenes]|nr:hypothetical protein GCM10010278_86320 [Streptomyces melanogenes]
MIGDEAMSGGMAWEALNNLGAAPGRPVIVVLNGNGRSYAPTTGALAAHLSVLKSGGGAEVCRNLFTDLGFVYVGPVDGHNTAEIETTLCRARAVGRPVVVHVMAVKGKDYRPAETAEADCLHAVGTADSATHRTHPPRRRGRACSGRRYWRSLPRNRTWSPSPRLCSAPSACTLCSTGSPTGSSMSGSPSSTLSPVPRDWRWAGSTPVVAIYATFLNRAFDQVLMDVALHRLPVTFVADRAGITGPNGPSHHGMWDLSLLSAVPGLRAACAIQDGPTALRLPKAAGVSCGNGKRQILARGQVLRTVPESRIVDALLEEAVKLAEQTEHPQTGEAR